MVIVVVVFVLILFVISVGARTSWSTGRQCATRLVCLFWLNFGFWSRRNQTFTNYPITSKKHHPSALTCWV